MTMSSPTNHLLEDFAAVYLGATIVRTAQFIE